MLTKSPAYTSLDETPEKVVRLLKSHQSGFISGEELSKRLGLSRAAVWKNIRKLKSLGYKIVSRQRSGYRLLSKTRKMLPWEISDGLQTEIIGRKIYYFDTIDSTQRFALELASRPYENGSIVIAERQTRGRGRQSRVWASPRGGIWLSILLRPNFEISKASLMPMLTSLALSVAIEQTLKVYPKLKWPNDLMLNDKKVAGILVDASIESNKVEYLIIGIGINFRIRPDRISKSLGGPKNGVATLVSWESEFSSTKLLQNFLLELELLYCKMSQNNSLNLKIEWERRSSMIGKKVTISTPAGKLSGKAVGIDIDGALLISKNGQVHRLLAGDIR